MSKHSARLNRMDGISSSADRKDGISVSVEGLNRIDASLEPDTIPYSFRFNRDGGVEFSAERLDGIQCTFTYTDKGDIQKPYLEIEPEVIWVFPDWAVDNDVFSNVTWHVN